MALTSNQIVLQLVAGMFAAPPGKAYLDILVTQLNTYGQQHIAIQLGNTPYFQSLYPTDQGGHAFANAYLTALVPAFSVADPAHLWALNWMAARFDQGIPAGQVVMEALQALRTMPVTHPVWGAALTHLNELTALATHFSVDLGLSGASLAELQDALLAPVFSSADVDGTTLTLHYTDLNGLDAANAPAAGAFTVMVGGFARSVSAVAVDAAAKTVVLTLSSVVFHGDAVTVAYADPTTANDVNAIQDAAGNDALGLAATTVTNNTAVVADESPPVFAAAAVDGAYLTLTYIDANTLDATHPPVPGDFTVEADDVANTVLQVLVNPTTKKIILVLDQEVTDTQTVTVAYQDPSGGDDENALQDASGHDAATLAETDVTNNSPDTTAPVFDGAVVVGKSLVMTYTDTTGLDTRTALTSAFAVMVDGGADAVTAVAIDADAKTVTLTLATAVSTDQDVTVAYTDPTGGDDSRAIQDPEGHDAATLPATEVTNNSPDAVAPVFVSAAVSGSSLVLSYSDISQLEADTSHTPLATAFTVKVAGSTDVVTAVAVNAAAKTVTLTLTTAVTAGQAVTVAYTDTTTGNDARAVQDALGNDAATFTALAVTNNTDVTDATAPVFSGATVNGKNLVMSYIDSSALDAVHLPAAGAFAVTADGVADVVKSVTINAASKTVTLTLATAVTNGQTVTVAYTDPSGGDDANAIQDAGGNDAASVSPAVTNLTIDSTVTVTGLAANTFSHIDWMV